VTTRIFTKPFRYVFYRFVAFKLSHPSGGSAVLAGSGSITLLLALNFMALRIAYNHYNGRPLFGKPTGVDYALVMCIILVTFVMSSRSWVDNGRWDALVREFGSLDSTRAIG
jgi:hypothetical protein